VSAAAAGRVSVATRSSASPRLGAIGWTGALIVASFAVLAVAGGWLSPYRTTQLAGPPLQAPSAAHLLGTNLVGQDLMSQLVSGARVSLTVAVLAGGGTILLGATIGTLAGWAGGSIDAVAMRVVDLVLITPRLPLLIVVGVYVGPSVPVIAFIIALTFWPISARVVRSQVLSLRGRAHVRAAIGFGAGTVHVVRRHLVPEVALILVAGLVASAGRAVLLEAGLAFLGLGDPTRASWGKVMRDAMEFGGIFHIDAWIWWLVPPVVAISLLLLGMTFLGIGVERRINPRLARHVGDRR
jgi:peptide/nickel transport system permease protein